MRTVLDALRRVTSADVVAVVNTHAHFDHTFGNAVLRSEHPACTLLAHEATAATTVEAGERVKGLYAADPDDPHAVEVLATRIEPATETFASVRVLDLGDRVLELVHPRRGHTGGDLVARVADADVVIAGDLVEQSAPAGQSRRVGRSTEQVRVGGVEPAGVEQLALLQQYDLRPERTDLPRRGAGCGAAHGRIPSERQFGRGRRQRTALGGRQVRSGASERERLLRKVVGALGVVKRKARNRAKGQGGKPATKSAFRWWRPQPVR